MGGQVRRLNAVDEMAWRQCYAGFWAHFGRQLEASLYDITWKRVLDPAEDMLVLGVFEGGNMMGIANVVPHRSFSAVGKDYYLHHLFVKPEARGRGYGRALIEALYAFAAAEGGHRVYWNTPPDNDGAISLYGTLAKETGYRLFRKDL